MYCTTYEGFSLVLYTVTLETYIVAVWILDEGERIVRDLIHKLHPLVIRRVVDTPLEDAASMTVSRNFYTVCRDRVVDELICELN